jgi:hypothetical protein
MEPQVLSRDGWGDDPLDLTEAEPRVLLTQEELDGIQAENERVLHTMLDLYQNRLISQAEVLEIFGLDMDAVQKGVCDDKS